jgi:hypothetical protein
MPALAIETLRSRNQKYEITLNKIIYDLQLCKLIFN